MAVRDRLHRLRLLRPGDAAGARARGPARRRPRLRRSWSSRSASPASASPSSSPPPLTILQGDARAAGCSAPTSSPFPPLLYVAWYLGWGHDAESHLSLRNMLASPRFVLESVAVALGSLLRPRHRPRSAARPTRSGAARCWSRWSSAFAYRQVRKPGLLPGLLAGGGGAAANWFLTAFNQFPGREPIASRYQYAGARLRPLDPAPTCSRACASASGRCWSGRRGHRRWRSAPTWSCSRTAATSLKQQSVLTRADTRGDRDRPAHRRPRASTQPRDRRHARR